MRLLGIDSLVTTRLPLADGRTISIRKPSQRDDEPKRVYQIARHRLGIGLPNPKNRNPSMKRL